jgi:hypothetical protein
MTAERTEGARVSGSAGAPTARPRPAAQPSSATSDRSRPGSAADDRLRLQSAVPLTDRFGDDPVVRPGVRPHQAQDERSVAFAIAPHALAGEEKRSPRWHASRDRRPVERSRARPAWRDCSRSIAITPWRLLGRPALGNCELVGKAGCASSLESESIFGKRSRMSEGLPSGACWPALVRLTPGGVGFCNRRGTALSPADTP